MTARLFTLDQARRLLPQINALLVAANDDLEAHACRLQASNRRYEEAEERLASINPGPGSAKNLRLLRRYRSQFQEAINELSKAQRDFVERTNFWVDKVSETGVILRDLREGLLDFPCRQGQLNYFLCWRLGEEDIAFWHLRDDGFVGRKPLAALVEYI